MQPSDRELAALAARLGEALLARKRTACTAESCTGGWVAKVMTDVPGSSRWFAAGFVTYANAAKAGLLDVPDSLLEAHGAVSEPVVIAMAKAAQSRTGAELAVAVSGVAGPGGGTADKPVGTVWFAWAAPDRVRTEQRLFEGNREQIRRLAVECALEGLLNDAMAGE